MSANAPMPTRPRLSVTEIDATLGRSRSRLERLVCERNLAQEDLAAARAEHARLTVRIRELDEVVACKNQEIFVVRPELEHLVQLQQQVQERATAVVRELKNPDAAGGERRHFARKPVSVDVSMVSESNFYTGFSQDVSEGGLFVATYEGIRPVGTRFPLVFRLPGSDEAIFCLVEVAWVREYREDQDMAHGSPGMGVRFIGLLDEDREKLVAFVEHREPLFHPETDELTP